MTLRHLRGPLPGTESERVPGIHPDAHGLDRGSLGPLLQLQLQLPRAALVSVSTLMVQGVLAGQTWAGPLTAEDRRGLTESQDPDRAGPSCRSDPHTLRHFLFTWLKNQGIDDALIQPYSGHATRQSLEIYSRLALADAQKRYDEAIGDFPV